MTLAAPGVAILAAAILVPLLVLLYFLKLKRREQLISASFLWTTAVRDMQANAPFQRLRMSLLLFLQLLALLLLLLALAQPEWEGRMAHSARTVLLIDRSASMTATDVAPSRFEKARQLALEYVGDMEIGGRFGAFSEPEKVMVIGFADEAQVYTGFTSSKAELISAIEGMQPTHGGSRLEEALNLARAHTVNTDPDRNPMGTTPPAAFKIFSDGRIRDIESLGVREDVVYRPIGVQDEAPDNVAIVAIGARRSYLDQTEVNVYVRLANYNFNPVSTAVFLTAGEDLIQSETRALPAATLRPAAPGDTVDEEGGAAGESASGETPSADAPDGGAARPPAVPAIKPGEVEVSFRFGFARGTVFGIEVERDDQLAADNFAYVVVPPSKPLRVGLVRDDNFALDAALRGQPTIETIERMTVERFNEFAARGETDQYDVIVIDGVSVERLGPGRYLMLTPSLPLEGYSTEGDPVDDVAILTDTDHPLNLDISYNELMVWETPPLVAPDTTRLLVEGSHGPLVVEHRDPGVHAVILPFDISRAPAWALDPSFVMFVQNAIEYLGHEGEALTEAGVPPGGAITARLPQGATNIRVRTPDEQTIPLAPIDPAYTSFGPVRLAGLYAVEFELGGAEQVRLFAVNLLNETESDIRAAPMLNFALAEEVTAVAPDESVRRQPLWPYCLLAALAVLMLEWLIYARRSYM